MRILHIYKDYFPIVGGIEGHLGTLAEHQAMRGHDVTVLVTNPGSQPATEMRNGVKVIRAPRIATVASTPISIQLPLLLRRMKPDIVHLQFPYPIGEVSQWIFGRKHPFVISYQSDVVKQKTILRFYGPILSRVLEAANRIIPSSPNYVQSSPWLKPHEARCTPVPIGIRTELFEAAAPDTRNRPGKPKILFLGRHRHYKGVHVLIEAMANVPDAQLLVGGDGPERANYEQAATRLGLSERVTFLGNVPDDELPGLYASADIFALPSINRAEAFGIVNLEAMASSLPVITTELSTGTSYIVQHEKTGLVVPPNDPAALAGALNRLVSDPELRQKYGRAGRERLLAEFTVDKMVDRIEAIYEEVLDEWRSR